MDNIFINIDSDFVVRNNFLPYQGVEHNNKNIIVLHR